MALMPMKKKGQNRDRVNAEIMHFYAKKCQKMQHQNVNASQDARC